MKKYAGIDVGGSFIKFGIFTNDGTMIFSDRCQTDRKQPEVVLDCLTEIINKLKIAFEIDQVGISIPGVINNKNQLVTSGAIENLFQYDVSQILEERTAIAIRLVNDANAVAYAENWLGAGQLSKNFVCLPLGTGVGGSIVIDGKVIKGRIGAAGEFGMTLMGLGKTEPVGYESASFYCGAVAGLCRIYNQKLGRKDFSEWEKNVETILQLADSGEREAIDSLTAFYQNIAVLLLNISVSLDPEKIIIGGGISENKVIMLGIKKAVNVLVERYKDMSALGFPEITHSMLGNKAGMIGAVSQLLEGEI